jgi:hypothetical protein
MTKTKIFDRAKLVLSFFTTLVLLIFIVFGFLTVFNADIIAKYDRNDAPKKLTDYVDAEFRKELTDKGIVSILVKDTFLSNVCVSIEFKDMTEETCELSGVTPFYLELGEKTVFKFNVKDGSTFDEEKERAESYIRSALEIVEKSHTVKESWK